MLKTIAGSIVTTAIIGLFVTTGTAWAAPNSPVNIPDNNLRNCILSTGYHANPSYITESEAANISFILCNRYVSNLTGLEKFTGLQQMNLISGNYTDITPISGLTNLETLAFIANQDLTDLSPLAEMSSLRNIILTQTGNTDVNFLSGLTGLTGISLIYSPVTDIAPLMALPNLTQISLIDTKLSDPTQLFAFQQLKVLALDLNDYDDSELSFLSNAAFTNLESLSLSMNHITDVTPIARMTNLLELYLDGNQIYDISPLASLTKLDRVFLTENTYTLPDIPMNKAQINPLRGANGGIIIPTGTGFTYDMVTHSWRYDAINENSLDWSSEETLGNTTTLFSGRLIQNSTEAVFTPEIPVAVPAIAVPSNAATATATAASRPMQTSNNDVVVDPVETVNEAEATPTAISNAPQNSDNAYENADTTLSDYESRSGFNWWILLLVIVVIGITIYAIIRRNRNKKS